MTKMAIKLWNEGNGRRKEEKKKNVRYLYIVSLLKLVST